MKPKKPPFTPATPLLNLLQQTGISAEQLYLCAKNYSSNGNQDSIEIKSLLQAAVELTGDPTLALRLGQHIDVASFGTFGFALMSCSTLRQASQFTLRYHAMVSPEASWAMHDHPNGSAIRLQLTPGNPNQQRLTTELNMSAHYSISAFLLNQQAAGVEIHFDYPAPAHRAAYQSTFPVPLLFDQAHSQFVINQQLLNAPVRTANPASHVIFLQQCEEMLSGLNMVEDTTAAVRRLLIQGAGNFPDIKQVAEQLHQSERSLSRRLNAESTNFRAVSDELKNVLAKKYLAIAEFTIADIAYLLGYTETVNFRRAFVRWNAVTPIEYRRRSI